MRVAGLGDQFKDKAKEAAEQAKSAMGNKGREGRGSRAEGQGRRGAPMQAGQEASEMDADDEWD